MMGIVFDIQKFSVHDGPGIRTSVFLKGCNLSCIWCHNPESIKSKPQLAFESSLCIGCRECEARCDNQAHDFTDGAHRIDFTRCAACGSCVNGCLAEALKIYGKEMSVTQVMDEIVSDRIYYERSGGGVTFTGGEPTMQFDFLMELIGACRGEGLHVCVETNGILNDEKRRRLAETVDLFLIDYKATPSALHKELTGMGTEEVLKTLAFLEKMERPVILRCPMIQGVNDSENHFAEIRRIRDTYTNIRQVEIMAYHSTGRKKWETLGIPYRLEQLESAAPEQKKRWEEMLRDQKEKKGSLEGHTQ